MSKSDQTKSELNNVACAKPPLHNVISTPDIVACDNTPLHQVVSNPDNAACAKTPLRHVISKPFHADDIPSRLQVTVSTDKRNVTDTNSNGSLSSTGKRSAIAESSPSGKKNKRTSTTTTTTNTRTTTETIGSSVTGLPTSPSSLRVSFTNDSIPSDSVPRLFSVFSKKSYPAIFIEDLDKNDLRLVTDYVNEQDTADGYYYWCVFFNKPSGFATIRQLPDDTQREVGRAIVKGHNGYKSYVNKMRKKHPDLF